MAGTSTSGKGKAWKPEEMTCFLAHSSTQNQNGELISPQNNLGHRESVSLVGSRWTRNLERSYREWWAAPLAHYGHLHRHRDWGRGMQSPSTPRTNSSSHTNSHVKRRGAGHGGTQG